MSSEQNSSNTSQNSSKTSRRQIRAKRYTSFDFLDQEQLIIHIYTIYNYIQEINTFKIYYGCVDTKVTFTIKRNNKLSNWMKTEPTTLLGGRGSAKQLVSG